MNNYLVTYNYIIVIRWIKCRIYIEITSIDFQKGNEVDFPEVLVKSDAEKKSPCHIIANVPHSFVQRIRFF